jgi:hypothetical protein
MNNFKQVFHNTFVVKFKREQISPRAFSFLFFFCLLVSALFWLTLHQNDNFKMTKYDIIKLTSLQRLLLKVRLLKKEFTLGLGVSGDSFLPTLW